MSFQQWLAPRAGEFGLCDGRPGLEALRKAWTIAVIKWISDHGVSPVRADRAFLLARAAHPSMKPIKTIKFVTPERAEHGSRPAVPAGMRRKS